MPSEQISSRLGSFRQVQPVIEKCGMEWRGACAVFKLQVSSFSFSFLSFHWKVSKQDLHLEIENSFKMVFLLDYFQHKRDW